MVLKLHWYTPSEEWCKKRRFETPTRCVRIGSAEIQSVSFAFSRVSNHIRFPWLRIEQITYKEVLQQKVRYGGMVFYIWKMILPWSDVFMSGLLIGAGKIIHFFAHCRTYVQTKRNYSGSTEKVSISAFAVSSVENDPVLLKRWNGAGTRNRTEDTSLEGWGFTPKLCPHQ